MDGILVSSKQVYQIVLISGRKEEWVGWEREEVRK
jgi:hypothetical protein